ncbi:hypothetical protein LTR95_010694 [Oleoguttula sp. CCFEE 5521]
MPTRVLIVGAGAVGAFYGSRLATTPNILVSALCRSNYKVVAQSGFRVSSPKFPDYTFHPEHTFASPAEARNAKLHWDYLLVSTKALPDVSDDSELLEGLVGEGTAVVLVQNGIGVEAPYLKRFPGVTVLSAVTIVGPYLPHLDAGGEGAKQSDAEAETKGKAFVEMLKQGGINDAEVYDHAGLQFVRWHKLAVNAAMNPSSVLSGGSGNQAMSSDSELSRHLLGVMNEVLETAPKVLGKPLPTKLAPAEKVLESTRKNSSGSKPSMAIDWSEGKRMELEVILGNAVRLAREKGVEMPRCQSMYALLRMAQENRAAAKSSKL